MTATVSWRYRIGTALFVLGWICPLFIPLVTSSSLSAEMKSFVSGALLIGAPEVFSLVSIAILGKDGFNYLKEKIFALLRRAAPSAKVSRTRYRIGIAIWGLLFVYGSFVWYSPHLVPGYADHRIAMNVAADATFIFSLFVLGGDFWEKFRALFIYEARATISR